MATMRTNILAASPGASTGARRPASSASETKKTKTNAPITPATVRPSMNCARARQERGQPAIARQHAVLMLADFFELGALGGQRNAVALQIDVNALRAERRALARPTCSAGSTSGRT